LNIDTCQAERTLTNTTEPSLFSPNARWLLTAPGAPFACGILAHGSRSATVQARRNWLISRGTQPRFLQMASSWSRALATSKSPTICEFGDCQASRGFSRHQIEGERPGSIAFSRTANTSSSDAGAANSSFLDFATRKERHPDGTHGVGHRHCLCRQGQNFVTSSSDRTVNLWDATSFAHLARFRGHVGEVWCVAISPDGRTAVSGSAEDVHGGRGRRQKCGASRIRTQIRAGRRSPGGRDVAGRAQSGCFHNNGWRVWTPEDGTIIDWPVSANPTVSL